jgi:hypothetical protein
LRILRNPTTVIVLSLAAAALLFFNVVWPILKRSQWMQRAPVAARLGAIMTSLSALPTAGGKKPVSAVEVNAPPQGRIDSFAAAASAARSTESPRRDPFESHHTATNTPAKASLPARDLLHFTGVWRQPGCTLAVINNQVFAAGESVLIFKIKSIEDDRVWVVGPDGLETVEFGARTPLAAVVPTISAPFAPPDNGSQTNSTP